MCGDGRHREGRVNAVHALIGYSPDILVLHLIPLGLSLRDTRAVDVLEVHLDLRCGRVALDIDAVAVKSRFLAQFEVVADDVRAHISLQRQAVIANVIDDVVAVVEDVREAIGRKDRVPDVVVSEEIVVEGGLVRVPRERALLSLAHDGPLNGDIPVRVLIHALEPDVLIAGPRK